MALNTHTFFCCEDNCAAEAHVSGGRCDSCFELFIAALRKEHNPTRCDQCREIFDSEHSHLLPSESGRFCGKWCEAGWLKEHDCQGFHYDEALEAYTCSECRSCYPEHKCSGEIDYERGHYVCDDRDDPRCPQNCAATRERLLIEIRNTETMLSWGYGDEFDEPLVQSLARLREKLATASLSPPVADPQPNCCADCGVQRKETTPVLNCDWFCPPCWSKRFSPRRNSVASPLAPPICTVCGGLAQATGICYPCKQATQLCADCGEKPKKGHFSCYRSDDPLCDDCEVKAHGPQSPVDWRECYGRCSKCDLYYTLICSSDRRDLCRWC